MTHRTVWCLWLLALLGAARPSPGWAQQPAPSTEQMVQVDPIRCWWRTSAGAVRIGETFELALTCAVLENEMVQVVPDESRLGGAVIQMAPWEIVASPHPSDLRSGQRRFFQYQYTMRILNPDAVGMDVPIPIVLLHYRVNSKIAANASLARPGRELSDVQRDAGQGWNEPLAGRALAASRIAAACALDRPVTQGPA